MKKFRITLVEFLAVGGAIAAVAAILVPNFLRARARGPFTACRSNLKNIGKALEMYSTDWDGHYPPELSTLVPTYLKEIPLCPGAGLDTYSDSYERGHFRCNTVLCPAHPADESEECTQKRRMIRGELLRERGQSGGQGGMLTEFSCPEGVPYQLQTHCESYSVHCHGSHHAKVGLPTNFPQYNGVEGLRDR